MGLFGSANDPVTDEVEKATNENNTEENWDSIITICDKAGKSSEDAKNYLRAIVKRLYNNDPHIAVQAVTLLDACVKNSGKLFHIEVASREFEADFTKLMQKSHPTVNKKLRESLKKWTENEFKTDSQLNLIPTLYTKLKNSGVDFSTEMPVKKPTPLNKDPNVVESQEEENQILKAIELSLKESQSSPRSSATSGSLYPSTSLSAAAAAAGGSSTSTPVKELKKVRALYDFEAAEENELTFKSGEIIFVIDDSDQNWWKGSNQRGEGLFPSNFVTKDLDVEPEKFLYEKAKKIVQFKESVDIKPVEKEPEDIEINEEKIDRLLHLLHEADPTNPETDTEEMLKLEREVNLMGPLIDSELEKVDRKHAQLTQLSADLVEALGLYHTLMREPQFPPKLPYNFNQMASPSPPNSMQPTYNGLPPPPNSMMGQGLPPPPHPQVPGAPNMHYGTLPVMGGPPQPQHPPPQQGIPPPGIPPYMMAQMADNRRSFGNMIPPNFQSGSQTLIHNGPPQSHSQHYMSASSANPK